MHLVEARLKVKGKEYQISVNLDEALKVKSGKGDITAALNSNAIYYDVKKGFAASQNDLENSFGTKDVYAIALRIIKEGEVQKTQEYRDTERENKIKQVVDMIVRNAVDQHGNPYTPERIRRALDELHHNFDKRSAEVHVQEVLEKLKSIIPIRIETRKIRLIIPARFAGTIYGILKDYKQSEEWLNNGDLEAIINIPAGMQIDFFEKLNAIAHGAIQSEEIQK